MTHLIKWSCPEWDGPEQLDTADTLKEAIRLYALARKGVLLGEKQNARLVACKRPETVVVWIEREGKVIQAGSLQKGLIRFYQHGQK